VNTAPGAVFTTHHTLLYYKRTERLTRDNSLAFWAKLQINLGGLYFGQPFSFFDFAKK